MATFGKSSKSRMYVIVYGEIGKYAKAALKIKLPNKIVNTAKGAATYMQKFLQKNEQILTVQAYEDLAFLTPIKKLPVWNDDEPEETPKKQKGRPKRTTKETNHGIEEFENLGTFLKGEVKDDGDKTTEE